MSEAPDTQEADAPELDAIAPETAADAPESPKEGGAKSQLEDAARQSGWAPKDQWKGSPEDWIDAPEFILKAVGEVLPSMRKSLQEAKAESAQLRKAVKDSIEHISKADQRAYDRATKEIQARLDAAAHIGDVQGVRDATEELVDLTKEIQAAPKPETGPETDEHFDAWTEANPWWGKDKAMTGATIAIANEVEAETGLKTGTRFYTEVTKRVKEAFPHKFENPNRRLPAAAEGSSPPRPRGKTYADLPADAKAMCDSFVKDIKGFKVESYVKDYFAQ
jgi:hypothetical protein